MIRATLAVVPSRLPVLWAKLIVLVGLVLPLSLLAAVAEFFVATALESSRGGSAISLTDPGVLREVVGASLYLTVIAVIGLALGALLRRTAAGLSVFAAVFFVVPIVAAYLPHSITGFAPYLPSNAGGALWGAGEAVRRDSLGPWTGFAVLCGYAVVLTGRGRLAAAPPRRLRHPEKLRGYKYVLLDTGREPGNAPAAFLGLRHRLRAGRGGGLLRDLFLRPDRAPRASRRWRPAWSSRS